MKTHPKRPELGRSRSALRTPASAGKKGLEKATCKCLIHQPFGLLASFLFASLPIVVLAAPLPTLPSQALESAEFALPLPSGAASVRIQSKSKQENVQAAYGVLTDEPNSLFAMVQQDGLVEGVILDGRGQWHTIRNDGQGGPAVIAPMPVDDEPFTCGVGVAEHMAAAKRAPVITDDADGTALAHSSISPVVSVLVGATRAAERALGGPVKALAKARLAILVNNAILHHSGASTRLALAGYALLPNVLESSSSPDDLFSAGKRAMVSLDAKTGIGADLLHMLAVQHQQGALYGGRAEILDRFALSYLLGPDFFGDFYTPWQTFVHEIGHNLSLWHDRATVYEFNVFSGGPEVSDRSCPTPPYAFGFNRQPIPGSNLLCDTDGEDWHTVMAYGVHLDRHACTNPDGTPGYSFSGVILRYSNPNKTYRGGAMGEHGDGCVPGWPRGPVNAVRALDLEASRTASHYGAGNYTPIGGYFGQESLGDGVGSRASALLFDSMPLVYEGDRTRTEVDLRLHSDNECITPMFHGVVRNYRGRQGWRESNYGCALEAPYDLCRIAVQNTCDQPVTGQLTLTCTWRRIWAEDYSGASEVLCAPPSAIRVSLGAQWPTLSFNATHFSAPEGGTLRLGASLSRESDAAVSTTWAVRTDGDESTANADVKDFGANSDLSGTIEFAPGETQAVIEIPVRDDADIEPASEFMTVALAGPQPNSEWRLGRRRDATIIVQEGVCDRQPAIRDALRGPRRCWEPSSTDLARISRLNLASKGISALRTNSFLGLLGLRALHLQGNRLETLPYGLLSGVANLTELDLTGNPGTPFNFLFRLARRDAEASSPGPAQVSALAFEGAPFPISVGILADRAVWEPAVASVPAGSTWGTSFQVRPATPGVGAVLRLTNNPTLPSTECGPAHNRHPCFQGFLLVSIPELFLFKGFPNILSYPPDQDIESNGSRTAFPLNDLFSPHEAGDTLEFAVTVDEPGLLQAAVVDGQLVLTTNEDGREGTAVVTVTARAPGGPQASIVISVSVQFISGKFPPAWLLGWEQEAHIGEANPEQPTSDTQPPR